MKPTFPSTSDRTAWPAVLLSLLPFFIAGPAQTIISFQVGWNPAPFSWVRFYALLLGMLAIAAGFGLGAARKFPRWAYPYAFFLPISFNLLLTNAAGAFHWNYAGEGSFFLFLALILILLYLPAFRSFYQNIRLDWTLLSYALFGLVFYLLSTIDHEETPLLNLQVLLPSLLALTAGLAHLRIRSAAVRVAALLAGTYAGLMAWLIPLAFGMITIWIGIGIWLFMVLGYGLILTAILLAPPLISTAFSRLRGVGQGSR